MQFERKSKDFDVPCIKCNILVRPKQSIDNWSDDEERSVVEVCFPVEWGYDKVKDEAIKFALDYIKKNNETKWQNNALFTGISFMYPSGIFKRYDHK